MKIVYSIMIALACIGFLLGVCFKLFADPASLPEWCAPPVLWRGAMGASALALIFQLMEIRDVLLKKKG